MSNNTDNKKYLTEEKIAQELKKINQEIVNHQSVISSLMVRAEVLTNLLKLKKDGLIEFVKSE